VWNAQGSFVAIPKFDETVQLQHLAIRTILGRRLWNAPAAGADSDATQSTELWYYSKLSVYMEKDDLLARILFCDEVVFHCIRKVNKQNGRILCFEPPREVVDYKCDCPMVS